MKKISPTLTGHTPGRRVEVFLANGLIDRLGEVILQSVGAHGRGPGVPSGKSKSQAKSSARSTNRSPIEIVTDRNVAGLLGQRVIDSLANSGWSVNVSVTPAGENIKSSATVAKLHNHWFELGYDRNTPVIALGGGTVGDVTGFAAATFLRGLPFWQVPTSIVAQVDAALGGKVGINHTRGKNLIGCFYQPAGIVIDPSALDTLPIRERCSGFAEVVKYGVIADRTLFQACERHLESWISGDEAIPDSVIKRCARIKLRIVAADETDHGLRRTLNFGHTLGHAFERWGKYRALRHGEAVALGMVGAGWMAMKRGLWSGRDFTRLAKLCTLLRPRRLAAFKVSDIARHLSVDKKRIRGRNVWILPRGIGRVDVCADVTEKEISGALSYIAAWLRS
ncbi:MAG: 3-dehydroquinate synthase [candidate division Zixibacteria bacterium]|nr:3-dehydroquinate synthase [candidate division Zixibacteria bacterium]